MRFKRVCDFCLQVTYYQDEHKGSSRCSYFCNFCSRFDFFLMSTNRLTYRQLCIKKVKLAQTRRHYSTSDEMRYILYGDGNQFSLYDTQLSEYIRSHISGPSLTQPRLLAKSHKARFPTMATFVDKLLSGRRNGFFVECGAADGAYQSNSLFFELKRNWTALLIEPNPYFYRAMLNKNRRAYVLRSCLSTQRRPATAQILPAGLLGGILSKMPSDFLAYIGKKKLQKHQVAVHSFPLNAIMAALNISHVDYLSLDVQGPELEILRMVDWTRLHIDVITVEYVITGGPKIGKNINATLNKFRKLRQFFRETGIYREVATLPPGNEAVGSDIVLFRI